MIISTADEFKKCTLIITHQWNYGLADRRPITSRLRTNQVWGDTTHSVSEDDYRTGCQNVSHCHEHPIQDYVYPDDHVKPTYEMTRLSSNLSQFHSLIIIKKNSLWKQNRNDQHRFQNYPLENGKGSNRVTRAFPLKNGWGRGQLAPKIRPSPPHPFFKEKALRTRCVFLMISWKRIQRLHSF